MSWLFSRSQSFCFSLSLAFALVVLLLALGQHDGELDVPLAEVHVERDQCIAGAFHHFADQLGNLALV